MAHTNIPGSRHAKRYLDVEELLENGIDVYTTLNIQHIESLNDVVAQITRVRVRETVPDSILDQADEVELADLSAEDLLTRLREGKVYVPEQAARAVEQFFRKGNLIALRELALRRTAERVDAQMRGYMAEHGIRETWPAGERLLEAAPISTAFGLVDLLFFFGLAAHSYVALEHAEEIMHRAMNAQIRPEAVEIELYLSVQLLARDGFGKKMA